MTLSFLNCYCLTSPKIFNYIWSIELRLSEICGVAKVRHEATSFMFLEEPSSASKIAKIAHQQTLGLLLSIFELLLSDLSSDF